MLENLCPDGTIEVSGTGKVEVSPDEAIISLTVLTQAESAAEAVAANALQTQAVLSAVAAEPHHRLVTTGLAVAPIYAIDPGTKAPAIVGYRASNTVEVSTEPIDAGRIYDAGVEAGASGASGIQFRMQDERPARAKALRRAVEQAYADAQVVAETAAIKLRGPEHIHVAAGPGPVGYRAATLPDELARSPVIPGDLTVAAQLHLVLRTKI
jgi:uncharacterized protein